MGEFKDSGGFYFADSDGFYFSGTTQGVSVMPFLICDPHSSATFFEIELDGVVIVGTHEDSGSGTIRLNHDVSGVTAGTHQARTRACNTWGVGPWTSFLPFNKQIPGPVTGFALV